MEKLSALRARIQQYPHVRAAYDKEGNEHCCGEQRGVERPFRKTRYFRLLFFVVVFGELGHEHECDRANKRARDHEYGHHHSVHHAVFAERGGGGVARRHQAHGEEYGNKGVHERGGGAHGGNRQRGFEHGLYLAFGGTELAALNHKVYYRNCKRADIGDEYGDCRFVGIGNARRETEQ